MNDENEELIEEENVNEQETPITEEPVNNDEREKKAKEIQNKKTIIGIALIIIGMIVCVIGVSIFVMNIQEGKGYISTEGKVISVETKMDKNKDGVEVTMYAPTVSFDVDGSPFEYISDEYDEKEIKIGEKINIKYDPDDPNRVVTKVKKTSPIIFIVAFIMVAIGVVVVRI